MQAPEHADGSAFDREELTRPDHTNSTSWGRLAAVIADLDRAEGKAAVDLVINWAKCGPNRRVLLTALARELAEKER